jgi:hypothetical protein
MANTNFEGWYIVSCDGENEAHVREVVGQFVSDGDLHLVARHPEKKTCEFVKLDCWLEGDLFGPQDRDAAEARLEFYRDETKPEAA